MSMVLWFKLGGGSAVKSPWHNVMYVNPIHTVYGMYKNTKTHVLAMRHRMYILIMDVIMSRLRHITYYTSSGFSLSHYLLFTYKLVSLKRGATLAVDDFINNIFWPSYEKIIHN